MRARAVTSGLLFISAGCGAGTGTPSPGSSSAPLPVTVTTASTADVPVEIRAVGTVEALDFVSIKPQIAGVVVDIRLEEGAEVAGSDPLILLDRRPFEAALHAAEAELARDRALAEDARMAAAQIEAALEKGSVSHRSAEQARAAAAAADALVRKDEAAVEIARLDVEYCTIRAPFGGRTGKLSVRLGSVVKANETEMVTLARIVPIRVAFAVAESRLAEIRKASADAPVPVRVEIHGSATRAQGILTFIDNAVDRASGTIGLMATFANEDRGLWPGQFVEVSVTTGIDRGIVVVPTRAVQRGQSGDFVFVVGQDRTVEARPVVVKRTSGDSSALAEGVTAGEVVVTDGQLRLVPGARVEPKEAAEPPTARSSPSSSSPSGGR